MIDFKILLPLALLLSSCAGGQAFIPTDAMVEEAGDVAYVIGDTSTQKEAIVHKSIQGYQTEYAKAFKESGTTITFELREVSPGVFVNMMAKMTSRGDVKMVAPPSSPSEHPVWRTVTDVLNKVTPWVGGYFIADSMFGAFDSMASNAGNKYYGDAQLNGSYNVAGNDQIVTTGTMNQHSDIVESLPEISLDDCLVSPPGGFNDSGVAMYNDTLSCGSYFE